MYKELGPMLAANCQGCSKLHSFTGKHEAHHTCPMNAWASIKQTKIGEYPATPDTCPYLR